MMSETEIRGVIWSFDEPIHYLTAIPWCTTHDVSTTSDECDSPIAIFDMSPDAAPFDEIPCVISTGPPDHHWWKDT